ncbi:MAG: hypothetical protein CMJ31_08770 [Phycisphaerae bacterium]|nr:hypothetical protein [Phycisphaerae bacterium]
MTEHVEIKPVPVPLTRMTRGQRGVLREATIEGSDGEMLVAMGLRPNCRLRVCRSGQTCIVAVETGCGGGCRIGLSRHLADRVMVEPIAAGR